MNDATPTPPDPAQTPAPPNATALFAVYCLKNVKSHMGDDSLCFRGRLYENGKPVGEVSNDGNGGCHRADFYVPKVKGEDDFAASHANHARFRQQIASVPTWARVFPDSAPTEDDLIDLLLERFENDKLSRTHTTFRLRTFSADPYEYTPTEHLKIKIPFEARFVPRLLAEHKELQRAGIEVWVPSSGWAPVGTVT